MGSWNMQEHWNSDLFWSGDGRICAGFPPLCVLYESTQTATFLNAPKNCIFSGASFESIQNLATLGISKLKGFYGTSLYHCYTLGDPIRIDPALHGLQTWYYFFRGSSLCIWLMISQQNLPLGSIRRPHPERSRRDPELHRGLSVYSFFNIVPGGLS